MTLSLFGAAVVPSLLILWYFRNRDLHPEPRSVVMRTFWYGVLITVPAALGEHFETRLFALVIHESPLAASLNSAFLCAAFIEELLKFWVLWSYASKTQAFDEPMDGIVYGVTASLGFATLENILYVSQHGMGTAVVRALLAVPGHAAWGAIMGYYVGQSRFGDPALRANQLFFGLAVPVVLHGLYDFPLMWIDKDPEVKSAFGGLLLLPVAVVAGSWWFSVRQVRRLRAQQEGGLFSPQPVEDTSDSRRARAPVGRTFIQWVKIAAGGLLATWGGLITLGVVLGVVVGGASRDDWMNLAIGTGLIGLCPLLAGVALFSSGVRRPATV